MVSHCYACLIREIVTCVFCCSRYCKCTLVGLHTWWCLKLRAYWQSAGRSSLTNMHRACCCDNLRVSFILHAFPAHQQSSTMHEVISLDASFTDRVTCRLGHGRKIKSNLWQHFPRTTLQMNTRARIDWLFCSIHLSTHLELAAQRTTCSQKHKIWGYKYSGRKGVEKWRITGQDRQA